MGKAKSHWDALVASVRKIEPKAEVEWRFYKPYGWTFIIRNKRRNLMYLRPANGEFLASLAMGETAVRAAQTSDLPAELIAEMLAGPKYPEGRPARVTVRTAAQARMVAKLVTLKVRN